LFSCVSSKQVEPRSFHPGTERDPSSTHH
jgi:hypothetical protein